MTLHRALSAATMVSETMHQNPHFNAANYLLKKHADLTQPNNLLDEALNQYSCALEQGVDADVLGKQAYALLKSAAMPKAENTARKALALDNTTALAHYVLGYTLFKQGHLTNSETHLKEAIRYGGLKTSRFRFCLAYNYFTQGKQHTAVARSLYQIKGMASFIGGFVALAFDDHPQEVHYTLQLLPRFIRIQRQAEDNTAEAVESLLNLHQQFPGMASVMNYLAHLYLKLEAYDAAEFWYRRAIQRDPLFDDSYEHLGNLLEKTERYDEALVVYQTLQRIRPNDWEVHCCMGNCYYAQGLFEKAKQCFTASLQLSNNPHWKGLMAQSLARLHQEHLPDKMVARQYLYMALEFTPEILDNYMMLGMLLFEAGDLTNAEIVYERALVYFADNAQVAASLGYLRWMKQDIEGATRFYHKAMARDPLYEIAYNNLGVISLDHQGNVLTAVDLFIQAIELNPQYALAHYNLGRAYSLSGDKLEAAVAFKRAQELNAFTHEIDQGELEDRLFQLFETAETLD